MRMFYKFWNCALFKKSLIKEVNFLPFFFCCCCCSFDERLNRISQDEQMDIYVHYWDDEKGLVKTNYLDTRFLIRPNADKLHDEFQNALGDIKEQKMLQLSMGGPNTSWIVFDLQIWWNYYLHQEKKKVEFFVLTPNCFGVMAIQKLT